VPTDDLYPPLQHSAWWILVALALLAVVAAWFTWVWWRTRPMRPPPLVPTELTGRSLATLRSSYLARIDAVAADQEAGRLPGRDVAQALSPLVRRFAFEATGFPAHVKSLAELRQERPGPLPAAVAVMYPDEFAERSGDGAAAVASARRLVAEWR